jgi:hypothetical protein
MTSTLEGLKQLASKEGYRHLNIDEMYASASQGCALCCILRDERPESNIPGRYTQFYVRYPILQERDKDDFKLQTETNGHPFEVAKLKSLRNYMCGDPVLESRGLREVSFQTFAAAGESEAHW